MFPQCYLSYMNNFPRAIPVTPGSYPSSMPGTVPMPMPGPEMFPSTIEEQPMQMEENIMGGGTMQMPETPQGGALQTPTTQSPFEIAPGAPTNLDIEYTQGYLRTQVGKRVRVTFLLGTNTIQDRDGILEKVGISYIILREVETNSLVLCDIYSIKFVNIFSR